MGKSKKLKIILVISCVIVIMIVSACQYIITLDEGRQNDADPKNVPSTVRSHLNESALDGYLDDMKELKVKPSKNGGYALDVDLDELVDSIIEDLNKSEGRLYLSQGKAHEYLKKMIMSEYITQYPDLRDLANIGTEVSDGEFQGIIQFIRHKSDDTEQTLEYMPLGEDDEVNSKTLYGLINQANGLGGVSEDIIQEARNRVLNHFSIDAQGNLIVANWSKTITKHVSGEYSTEYPGRDAQVDYSEDDRQYLKNADENVTYQYFTHIVNYKSVVSQYTMPFNYLWAFLVCGRDEEFISDFSDLVLDSTIEIGIYDNLTEIEETTIEAYNDSLWEQIKVSTRTVVDGEVTASSEGPLGPPEIVSTMHKFEINYTKTYSNSITVAVTNLDIWYMKYSASYEYEVEDSGEDKTIDHLEPIENDKVIENGEWQTVSRTEEPIKDATGNVTRTKVTEKLEKTDRVTQRIYTQRTFTTIYHTIKQKYTLKGDPEVFEKTDPRLKDGDEGYPNFCTLYINSLSARGNISGAETWLFAIIESNSDTVNMLELTKYMFYCATGINWGVTSFNFDVLYPTESTGDLYGGTVEEQVWFALLDAGYSKEAAAGVLGNLQHESGIRTNNLQNSANTKLKLSDEEYTEYVDNGTYTKFITDQCGYGIAQWTSEGRKKGLYDYKVELGVSISDARLQIEYLLGEISKNGGANGHATYQMGGKYGGSTYDDWFNAKTPEDAATAFCKVFERPKNYSSLASRRESARQFYEKYKDKTKDSLYIGDIELSEENKQKMYNMLNDAVRIANDDRYGYSQARRMEEFYYDCSSLVYRLYKKHFNIEVPLTTAGYPIWYKYNVGKPSQVELQPGDVLWIKGHVIIYIGNGNYVAARSGKFERPRQIEVYQANKNDYTYVYRFIGK